VSGTRHLVRTGQEDGKDACRIVRLRPPQRTRKRVGGEDLCVKTVRDLSLPAARGAASYRPEAGRGARCDGESPPRRRLIPAVASSGPPGLRLPRSLPPASVRGAGERLRYDEDGEHEKARATPSAVGQRLLLDQGTRVHQPRMCPDNFMLPVMPAARARMWPSCMATPPSILVLRQDPSVFEACAAAPVGNSLYAHTSGLVPDGRFLTSGNGDLSWFR
jgi:hypothetical protein